MKVILRNFEDSAQPKLIECKGLSVSYEQNGVFIEADNYADLFADLVTSGYKCVLQGKILTIEAKSIYCFD